MCTIQRPPVSSYTRFRDAIILRADAPKTRFAGGKTDPLRKLFGQKTFHFSKTIAGF